MEPTTGHPASAILVVVVQEETRALRPLRTAGTVVDLEGVEVGEEPPPQATQAVVVALVRAVRSGSFSIGHQGYE